MGEYILETKKVTKAFGNLIANCDIDLQVEQASVHSIIGENGAGKSTLMNMLAGIFKPTSGEILLNGLPQVFKSPNDASAVGIGMVHQEFMLYPDLSVVDNIMMGFESVKAGVFLDKENVKQKLKSLCKQYDFDVPLDELVKDLPVSIKQQVEIVKVLYRGADIIILDEPTSVLTPQGVQGLFAAIRSLKKSGKTILMITHKLDEVMEISDHITVLKDGRVTGNIKPENTSIKQLANLMVGRDVLFTTHKKEKKISSEVLTVDGLTVHDDNGVEKVHNVSFNVKKGEIVGIAGVAGAGQTELVECLFGLRKATSGSIIYGKQDITRESPKQRRFRKVGYVPQDRIATGSSVDSSVTETAIMGYHLQHCRKHHILLDYKQANDFARKVINDYAVKTEGTKNRVGSLSGGNIQKLIVGREFSQDCEFLLIEDPTRGIDVGAIEFIWQKIIDIADQGTSVLLISHELSEVMELSDRILVLYGGRIVAELENKNLTEQQVGLFMLGGGVDSDD